MICKSPLFPSSAVYYHVLRLFHLTDEQILCRFNEIRVTDPSYGYCWPALTLESNSTSLFTLALQFNSIPQTTENPFNAQSLRWTRAVLEVLSGTERVYREGCHSKCLFKMQRAKGPDDAGFQSPIHDRHYRGWTASIEFFIKCYPQHHPRLPVSSPFPSLAGSSYIWLSSMPFFGIIMIMSLIVHDSHSFSIFQEKERATGQAQERAKASSERGIYSATQ